MIINQEVRKMQEIVAILTQAILNLPEAKREILLQELKSPSSERWVEQQTQSYNMNEGDLDGFYCEVCKNKGRIAYVDEENDRLKMRVCKCMAVRICHDNMSKSGLKDLLKLYTFENYETPDEWQKSVKYRASKYTSDFAEENEAMKWFCIFGAVGSGKTHICTAICNKILKSGGKVSYMLWREESVRLKALINDESEYKRIFKQFKEADNLYIDDFFKGKKGASPTEADINLAFELINHRYYLPNSKTIISSEKTFDEILELDEAIGSRISQRCGEYYRIKINPGDGKNWRLKT
jgi:DNA replication protein DnaC